jgi:hypothetical protein
VIRRRYIARAYAPTAYAPYEFRKFRTMSTMWEWAKAERARPGFESVEFIFEDRLTGKRHANYPKAANGG